jgi:hypothetical protein
VTTSGTPLDLGVVIVTWNVRALVLNAVDSLLADLRTSQLAARVVVVDSASSDGTVDAVRARFPEIDVIACRENVGFVRGNNLGMRALGLMDAQVAKPPAVYLLNPDTITQPGATRRLYDTLFSQARNGLVGARLSYGDGRLQPSAFRFPGLVQLWAELFPFPDRLRETPLNGRYPLARYAGHAPFAVDFVLGATMMLRTEAAEATGLFDERFFMYCEEIDWAVRLRRAGWRVLCEPRAHVVHLAGASSSQVPPATVERLWRSRLLLYRLHEPRWRSALFRRLIRVGMQRRAARTPDRALAGAYRQVAEWAAQP